MCYMSITDILQMQKYDIFFINYPFLNKKENSIQLKILVISFKYKTFL